MLHKTQRVEAPLHVIQPQDRGPAGRGAADQPLHHQVALPGAAKPDAHGAIRQVRAPDGVDELRDRGDLVLVVDPFRVQQIGDPLGDAVALEALTVQEPGHEAPQALPGACRATVHRP